MSELEEQAPDYTGDDLKRIGQKWLAALRAAEKREKEWIDDAKKAESAFLCEDNGDLPAFNILHSNINTVMPAVFNSEPVPEIRPRYGIQDPAVENVTEIFEREIRLQSDDSKLEIEIEGVVQDVELAGRGVLRVKFDADEDEVGNPVSERLVFECVSWRDYREGPAKRWRDVPWVAYRHEVSEQERQRLEDGEMMGKQEEFKPPTDDKDSTIWEIWCKETRKVYFIIEISGHVLNVQDDPLGLKGFFPQPQPVQPVTATGKRTPVCPYASYSTLADELDRITKRINAIMRGLKVRGGIAGNAQDIDMIAQAGDNELVPLANVESLIAQGGLDKAVLWWPIETAIMVLRELYVQREATKQAIYEITGISDIIRGASDPRETKGAQQIKAEAASLRIKRKQTGIQRLARDAMVISAEIISKLFSVQTLMQHTGIQITEAEMAYLQRPLDHFKIDIETDSTIRADLTRSRGEMSEFLKGTAEFFGTMAPIVGSAPATAAPLARMYQAFAQQFSLGKAAEDALDQFVEMAEQAAEAASQQPQQDPNAPAMAEQQMKMGELQLKAKEVEIAAMEANMQQQADMQIKAAELAQKDRSDQLKAGIDAQKLEIDRAKLELERMKLGIEEQKANHEANAKLAEIGVRDTDMAQERLTQAMDGIVQAIVAEVRQGNAQLAAGQQALANGITQANAQIVQAITAPKEIVRDENGRPVGARVVMEQQKAVN